MDIQSTSKTKIVAATTNVEDKLNPMIWKKIISKEYQLIAIRKKQDQEQRTIDAQDQDIILYWTMT